MCFSSKENILDTIKVRNGRRIKTQLRADTYLYDALAGAQR